MSSIIDLLNIRNNLHTTERYGFGLYILNLNIQSNEFIEDMINWCDEYNLKTLSIRFKLLLN